MSLRKVYGGTPVGSESRCDTCSHARIIQGYAESERIVFCDAMYDPIRIPFKVSQCSDYEDRRLPTLEAALTGAPLDGRLADRVEASHLAPLSPIDDVRGSAAYRSDATATVLRRLLRGLAS